MVITCFPDVCVRSVPASIDFYRALLGLEIIIDQRWYAELGMGGATMVAFVQRGHETVPRVADARPVGVLLSFVVDDVDPVGEMAERLGCVIVWPLATELGQRHVMITDPDEAIIDVIQRVPLTSADRRRLVELRRGTT